MRRTTVHNETPKKFARQKNIESRNCGKTGHYARRLRQPEIKRKKNNTPRKLNVVRPKGPWSSSEDESGEEVEVMNIDNAENHVNKSFVLKRTINRKPIHALIDTGSSVTIFTKAHVQKIFRKIRNTDPLNNSLEKYIDFSSNKIEFIGVIIGQVELVTRKLKKVRVLVAQKSSQTLIGRNWLRGLGINLKTEGYKCENNLSNEPPNKLFTEFREPFSRHG